MRLFCDILLAKDFMAHRDKRPPGDEPEIPCGQLLVSRNGAGAVLTAIGELDLATTEAMRDALNRLAGNVLVDLSRVTFLDSSTIGVLVGSRNRLVSNGGDLRLRRPQEAVRQSLELVGLGGWIDD